MFDLKWFDGGSAASRFLFLPFLFYSIQKEVCQMVQGHERSQLYCSWRPWRSAYLLSRTHCNATAKKRNRASDSAVPGKYANVFGILFSIPRRHRDEERRFAAFFVAGFHARLPISKMQNFFRCFPFRSPSRNFVC